jgi:anti-sigma28 factor (negative regulator of flagellin synthesis)
MKAVVRHLSSKPAGKFASAPSQAPLAAASPEQDSSATSGTYFRAVRLDESEAAAALADEEKLARVGSLLDSGLWRVDSELVASRLIDLAARKVDSR